MSLDDLRAYWPFMSNDRQKAEQDFWRMLRWSVVLGILMAIGAIIYLGVTGELHFHMVVATLGGVFLSIVLGCGLMAASFFSDKSGHDDVVTDATKQNDG